MFIAYNVADIVTALISQTPVDALDMICVWIADLTSVAAACLVGGFLLWRREVLGYVGGAGLLLSYSLLFAALIPLIVFPAFYNASPIDVGAIVMILVMGSVCFISFALFVRGIVRVSMTVRKSAPSLLLSCILSLSKE